VLENSQGHAILGANYWKQQGAIIIAHKAADKNPLYNSSHSYNPTPLRF
jgi:hypothetical protein